MYRLYLMGADIHWGALVSFGQEMLSQTTKHFKCVNKFYVSFSAARHGFVQKEGVEWKTKRTHTSNAWCSIFPRFQHGKIGKITWRFRPTFCFPMHALPTSDSPVCLFQHINFFLFFYFHCLFTRRRRKRDNEICIFICLVKGLFWYKSPWDENDKTKNHS